MQIIHGVLGWGNNGANTKSSLDCYGPGGRWADGADELGPDAIPMGGRNGQGGDLLADALARVGCTEGESLIVIAISRNERIEDNGIVARVDDAVRAAIAPLPDIPAGTDGLVVRLRKAAPIIGECTTTGTGDLVAAAADWINAQGAEMSKCVDRAEILDGEITVLKAQLARRDEQLGSALANLSGWPGARSIVEDAFEDDE